MTISKPMAEALRYVARVRVVTAWPDDIKDGTIRQLRRHRLVVTEVTSWHVHPAGGMYWSSIKDKLSPKGRAALKGLKAA